jgi:hypothetical protein
LHPPDARPRTPAKGVALCTPEMHRNGKLEGRNLLPDPLYNAGRWVHNPRGNREAVFIGRESEGATGEDGARE